MENPVAIVIKLQVAIKALQVDKCSSIYTLFLK